MLTPMMPPGADVDALGCYVSTGAAREVGVFLLSAYVRVRLDDALRTTFSATLWEIFIGVGSRQRLLPSWRRSYLRSMIASSHRRRSPIRLISFRKAETQETMRRPPPSVDAHVAVGPAAKCRPD
jgi:hypothetical protein